MKKYCIVGTGGRGIGSYAVPLVKEYGDCAELAGVYDLNPKRAHLVSEFTGKDIPVYDSFDAMLSGAKPDVVIVTTKDSEHSTYIIRALEFGCDVISEKPLTTDEVKLAAIIEAERRTGHRVTVTFNMRFMPFPVRLKELLTEGVVGDILSVHFEWLLDTDHGASYFRRWHGIRKNSGSLLIHKATHHFDMANWLIDQEPLKVNCFGTQRVYGPHSRAERGERCLTCQHKKTCEFYYDITADEHARRLYLDCEDVDGYWRDRCLFADEVDIEDSISLNVRYSKGAVMSYSLTAHSPYECFKIVINGTKGRMEADSAFGARNLKIYNRKGEEVVYHHVDKRPEIGGHGGADPRLRDMLFRGIDEDPLGQMADTRAGAMSCGIGIAANISMKENRAVSLTEFLGGFYDM